MTNNVFTGRTVGGPKHMQRLRVLLLPLLIALPVASAGGYDASVDYFETDETGCATDADGAWYGNHSDEYSWSYSWYDQTTSCADSFTYAGATVSNDDGEVASAGAGTRSASDEEDRYESSSSRSRWNDSESSYYSSHYEDQNATSDGREAAVSTREGSLAATDGCASSEDEAYSYESSGWSSGDYSSGWSRYSSQGAGSSGCATSATLQHGQDEVTVTPAGQTCAGEGSYASESSGSRWGNDSYGSYSNAYSHRDECAGGASADVDGFAVFAGSVSRCEGAGASSTSYYGNESSGWSEYESACETGYAVRGPDGIELFVGTESESSESCSSYGECYTSADNRSVVRLSWVHSPLGSSPWYVLTV